MKNPTQAPLSRAVRALVVPVAAVVVALTSGCASMGASVEPRSIEDIPELEALPPRARPVVRVSLTQSEELVVPPEFRWLTAFARSQDPSVASGSSIETRLRQALSASGRFHVRTSDFTDYRAEQSLQRKGDIREGTGADGGQVVGTDYFIKATVVDLNYGEEESETNVSGWLGRIPLVGPFLGWFSFGKEERVARVTIVAEISNAESMLVVNHAEARGYQTSTATNGAFYVKGIRVSQSEKEDPTLANAIAECIKELVFELAKAFPESA